MIMTKLEYWECHRFKELVSSAWTKAASLYDQMVM